MGYGHPITAGVRRHVVLLISWDFIASRYIHEVELPTAIDRHVAGLVADYTFAHTRAGLAAMLRRFARDGVERVGIERPDGPVVDTLLDAGFAVLVIPPRQMINLRGRYGSTGSKDDLLDAFVLAHGVRTDHRRLRPLKPDTDATWHYVR